MAESLNEFYEMHAHSPGTAVFRIPGFCTMQSPMLSINYANCNGVALLANGFGTLTHYDDDFYPEAYLCAAADDIAQKSGVSSLCDIAAVPVGGDPTHFSKVMTVLDKLSIPVVGYYLDSLCTHWTHKQFDKMQEAGSIADFKDVLVIPSIPAVIVHTRSASCRLIYSVDSFGPCSNALSGDS